MMYDHGQVLIHVFHRHVETLLNVDQSVIDHRAHAYQITLELHQIVDQNVLLTVIVHRINLVSLNVAVIHVKDHVVLIQNVAFKIIFQFVHVDHITLAIHSLNVLKLLNNPNQNQRIVHVIRALAVAMLSVIMPFARVLETTLVILILVVDQNVP